MSSTRDVEPIFFGKYWQRVAEILHLNPKHKSTAIELSVAPRNDLAGPAMVRALREALEGDWWKEPKSTTAGNWVWRDKIPAHVTESPEVKLERAVMAATVRHEWTCQMSTSSGLRGSRTDKRRAIDLVHRSDPTTVQFIELKVNSDNPAYAAFEILGYGLAYYLARRHAAAVTSKPSVLDASRVHLMVLAPHSWFEYRLRDSDVLHPFNLQWLAASINDGLASEIQTHELAGLEAITFSFQSFAYADDLGADVTEVLRVTSL